MTHVKAKADGINPQAAERKATRAFCKIRSGA